MMLESEVTSRASLVNGGEEEKKKKKKEDNVGETVMEISRCETEAVNPEANRILYFAEVFDLRTYSHKLVKVRPDKKLDKKKPVLVERRIINHKGQHTHTEVDVKSRALCNLLIEINSDVEGLTLRKEPPFADPALFFHSRVTLQESFVREQERKSQDAALVADISTALRYIDEKHGHNVRSVESLLSNGEITWDLLWALYTPNSLLYHFHEYTEQAQVVKMRRIKVKFREDQTKYLQIVCDMISDDGLKFGYTKDLGITPRPDPYYDLEIDYYEGAKKVEDLVVYPLQYTRDEAVIRAECIERGKKYVRLSGHSCWESSGPAMRETINERYEINRFKFGTHGRTIVDAPSFRTFNSRWACIPTINSGLDRNKLTDEQLLICSPFAFGFNFGAKSWGAMAVSRLQDVCWRPEAFDSLVVAAKQKTLIHSLVKQHTSEESGFDDVIQGKGRGLIGLLSGRPGCGKTLTAEAVAEVTKRPLYAVSAGELGTDPEKVDKQLTLVLDLAHRWSAILLLDEADVFLQERDTKDVARNALVSIFLRQLEYFQGILILTTNRIGDCDPAFESRIHFSIHYPDLDYHARKSIWKTFIERAQTGGESRINDKDIESLAVHEMNGRQIKHTVGSARSIAREHKEQLNVSHMEAVLEVVEAWNSAKLQKHKS